MEQAIPIYKKYLKKPKKKCYFLCAERHSNRQTSNAGTVRKEKSISVLLLFSIRVFLRCCLHLTLYDHQHELLVAGSTLHWCCTQNGTPIIKRGLAVLSLASLIPKERAIDASLQL